MKICTHNSDIKKAPYLSDIDLEIFEAPIECIRRLRSFNLNSRFKKTNGVIYKILKSYNGRRLFA